MEDRYDNNEAGCKDFVEWLLSQAKSSAEWKHIQPDDKRDLEKAREILTDDPAALVSARELTHLNLWRFMGAAFMIGRCANFADSDVAYYERVYRPAQNRKTKAEKKAVDPEQVAIAGVVEEMTQEWDGLLPWPMANRIADRLYEKDYTKGCSADAIHRRLKKIRPRS